MVLGFVSGLILYRECLVDLRVAGAASPSASSLLTRDVDDLADLDIVGVGDLWIGRFQSFIGYAELLCYFGDGVTRLDCVGGHAEVFASDNELQRQSEEESEQDVDVSRCEMDGLAKESVRESNSGPS